MLEQCVSSSNSVFGLIFAKSSGWPRQPERRVRTSNVSLNLGEFERPEKSVTALSDRKPGGVTRTDCFDFHGRRCSRHALSFGLSTGWLQLQLFFPVVNVSRQSFAGGLQSLRPASELSNHAAAII